MVACDEDVFLLIGVVFAGWVAVLFDEEVCVVYAEEVGDDVLWVLYDDSRCELELLHGLFVVFPLPYDDVALSVCGDECWLCCGGVVPYFHGDDDAVWVWYFGVCFYEVVGCEGVLVVFAVESCGWVEGFVDVEDVVYGFCAGDE